MKIARIVAGILLMSQLCFPAMALDPPSKKAFSSAELGLSFLDDPAKMTAEPDQLLTKVFNDSVKRFVKMKPETQTLAKPLADQISQLKGKLLEACKGKSAEMKPFLAPYQVLAKSPVTYEQLTGPKKSNIGTLVAGGNEVLKHLWRINASIQLSEQLLPKLKEDSSKLKPADALKKASLGVVTVSLANLNLGAFQSVDKINKKVAELNGKIQKETAKLQGEMTKHPEKAMALGEDVQTLTALTSTLGNALAQAGSASPKLPGIGSNLTEVLAKLL